MTARTLLAVTLCGALLGCGDPARLRACDITLEACQQEVYVALSRLRGDGFDPFGGVPPIETVPPAVYEARIRRDVDRPDADMTNPDTRALRLLGMLSQSRDPLDESIDDLVNNVAAIYEEDRDRVTVIDRGETRNELNDTAVLVHELVHALQARDGLLSHDPDSTDARFAHRALVEGEATHYALLAAVEMTRTDNFGSDWGQLVDWRGFYDRMLRELGQDLLDDTSSFLAVSRRYVYPLGGYVVTKQWVDGGNVAVRRLWERPPSASLPFVQRQLVTEHARPLARCRGRIPLEGFEQVTTDSLGAPQLYGFLYANGTANAEAWQLAGSWQDDRIFIFYDEAADEVAVTWHLRLDSAAAAERLANALAEAPIDVTTQVLDGGDARIHAAEQLVDLHLWDSTDCP